MADVTSQKGFSLTEVLVVIAVVMLLAAMVLPLLQSARNVAYKAGCMSNLRQIGMALEMYSHNYKDYYPVSEDRAPYAGDYQWSHWGMKIKPYLDKVGEETGYISNQIMKCPGDRDTFRNAWSTNSYAYNEELRVDKNSPLFVPYSIRNDIILVVDGYAYFSRWSNSSIYYRHDTSRIDNYKSNDRKGGTANGLFCDLHVQNMRQVPQENMYW